MMMDEWKFKDEIIEYDVSKLSFIDEDGNVCVSELPDWSSLPSLTFEFELEDEDKEYLNDIFIKKKVLDLGFLFERMKLINVRRETN